MSIVSLVGTQLLFVNTYHILANNAQDLIQESGGIHSFMRWNHPVITDSGGFQVLSLSNHTSNEIKSCRRNSGKAVLLKIDEDGALFTSYKTGQKILLSPETSIETQIKIGSDFIVAMDECTSSSVTEEATRSAMERSLRWTNKSYEYYLKHANHNKQSFYAVYQGGTFEKVRKKSCEELCNLGCFGYAIGGSLGKNQEEMRQTVDLAAKLHSESKACDRPLHLLGIGSLEDVIWGVQCGIDTFDCTYHTRAARHGSALVSKKTYDEIFNSSANINQPSVAIDQFINLKNHRFLNDQSILDPHCECECCAKAMYTRSYLNYLTKTDSVLAGMILSQHNMFRVNEFLRVIRQKISEQQPLI